jgi:glutamyl-tRNA synthetase/glutamyl-Q tRNA(Asp) synthetase
MGVDLDALAARIGDRPLTRFAPSPTGYLHLGHVVNAIYVWGVARALGGRVLLRVEDHDRLRSRPEYEAAIREDLAWLGFRADADAGRQSDDSTVYEAALERLRRVHHVYACDCSRKDIGGEHYAGRCRERDLEPRAGRGLRVAIDAGEERFDDALLGAQAQNPSEQCGDLLIRDRDGHWTYQFAVTVDDARQGINLVIRGADLLSSTGRQIRLARMLGRATPPVFLHHPILLKPSGEKLSKSSRDTGVKELREAGVDAEEVIGRAAAEVGLIDRLRRVNATHLEELFTRRGGLKPRSLRTTL